MPEVSISKDIHVRMKQFKQIIEAVIEEEIDFDKCADLVLSQGMDSMLIDIIGSVDQTTLLRSFQQLGSQFPGEVYGYVAETLRRGASNVRERLRQQIGFRPTKESGSSSE